MRTPQENADGAARDGDDHRVAGAEPLRKGTRLSRAEATGRFLEGLIVAAALVAGGLWLLAVYAFMFRSSTYKREPSVASVAADVLISTGGAALIAAVLAGAPAALWWGLTGRLLRRRVFVAAATAAALAALTFLVLAHLDDAIEESPGVELSSRCATFEATARHCIQSPTFPGNFA